MIGFDANSQVGISGPYNPVHLNHITSDWKWTGDLSVFIQKEFLGQGYIIIKTGRRAREAEKEAEKEADKEAGETVAGGEE